MMEVQNITLCRQEQIKVCGLTMIILRRGITKRKLHSVMIQHLPLVKWSFILQEMDGLPDIQTARAQNAPQIYVSVDRC